MQLSPLQSRLAASVIASCFVIVLYFFLFTPQFALAAELAQIPSTLEQAGSFYDDDDATEFLDVQVPSYEPNFPLFDRGIIGRAADGAAPLDVDNPTTRNLDPGMTTAYVFEVASVSGRSAQEAGATHELRRSLNETREFEGAERDGDEELSTGQDLVRRQTPSRTLYISVNTCDQPGRISPDQTSMDPPQLTLFVSTSSENTSPGPGGDEKTQKAIVFDEGAVLYNTSLDSDVYFSISAPQVSAKYFTTTLPYNYEVAVSLDEFYHSYDSETQPNLYWVDSDASSSLLTTQNLTSRPEEVVPTAPYIVFVQNKKNLAINGIRKSYCGLKKWAQIRPLQNGGSQATTGLRQGGDANLTTQEFYISGLNASTEYSGIIALNTSLSLGKRQESSSGGGMVVYSAVDFSTKPNGACTFIFNLTVCTETRYAVPGNPEKFPNGTALAAYYDDYTKTMWDNFDKVLQQTPCEAPPTQKYSLIRNCDDCKQAYKNWLCSVAIPRCEDFSTPDQDYLQMRNINAPFPNGTFVDQSIRDKYGGNKAFSSSRNVEIDEAIEPGPYKEVLPCDYLCYELVKSCPSSMGFACPLPNSKYGFNTSYAVPDTSKELSCNYPGSAYYPSAATLTAMSWMNMVALIVVPLLLV
ncbi:stretch-activated Ca2+-permeable channel component-domain-containing protein [Xylaria bambusicola]|uniref:stretch-activated Ca2+-permeable channel component-domain-containing protein n=1 Tax=Xylaria bambusicola TaxID=326684 RepID=UPI00200887A5|nr:stretch-activated Ca2+-permeable channel component-domain-containing protein [Xylaria bambusicola]KAI0502977.1 stretch-activated Ca2+-permeable channel component-domain-containing protein [Xylaria bambusicola]